MNYYIGDDKNNIEKQLYNDMLSAKISFYEDTTAENNRKRFENNSLKYNNFIIENNLKDNLADNFLIEKDLIENEEFLKNNWTSIISSGKIESNHDEVMDILIELIYNRRKQAYIKCEKNTDYSFYSDILRKREGYGRKEIGRFRDNVLKYIKPSIDRLNSSLSAEEKKDISERYERLDSCMPKKCDEFIDRTLDFYREYSTGLYYILSTLVKMGSIKLEKKENKAPAEFTCILPVEKKPVIFGQYRGIAEDIDSICHEFGHAVQMYMSKDYEKLSEIFPSLDTCELISIFMEVSSEELYKFFFGKGCMDYIRYKVLDALNIVMYACAVDEFQEKIYGNEFIMQLESLSKDEKHSAIVNLWENINLKYTGSENTEKLFSQGHIYRDPFYFIEYAFAYIVSLKLIELDRDARIEKIMKLASMGGKNSYVDTIEIIGMENPFEEKNIKAASKRVDSLIESLFCRI